MPRSILSVGTGLLVLVALSAATNYFLRVSGLYPHGSPAFALFYRSFYLVLGSYCTALIAPSRPMLHALVLGTLCFVQICCSAVYLMRLQFYGPDWYYYSIAAAALPSAWLGGMLQRSFARKGDKNAA